MILSSTLRKLADKSATIYRVDVPAHVVTMGNQSVPFPAHYQYFATLKQAEKFASESVLFSDAKASISTETASMEKHYWNT